MSFQTTKIWSRFWSYTWEVIFTFVFLCGIILVGSLIYHLVMVYKKKPKFQVNQLSLSFFWISPILIIVLLITEFFWRINAFYGVSTFYVSYWYEYLIFSIVNYLVILSIWIIKSVYTKRFKEYKKEIVELKHSSTKSFLRIKSKITILCTKTFRCLKSLLFHIKNAYSRVFEVFKKIFQSENKVLDKIFPAIEGKIVPLSQVQDKAFSKGYLGKGIGIIPDLNRKIFVAPVTGEILTMFHTNHAYGIKTTNNTNVLVHIGLETINLNGKYFTPLKKVGDKVNVGEPIIKADLESIKKAGYDVTTILVCTKQTKGNVNIFQNNFDKEVKKDKAIIWVE